MTPFKELAVQQWREFTANGFHDPALFKQHGKPAVVAWVGFVQPDVNHFGERARSKEYEIEYLYDDLPALAKGDQVTFLDTDLLTPLPKAKYALRDDPTVSQNPAEGMDGTYRRALLTRAT